MRPAVRRGGPAARLWLAAALAAAVLPAVLVLTTATPALALGNGLALTPPMGWNDWNAYGCSVSEQLAEQTALAMHNDGMQAAGYDYVNIDDCWMSSSRAANGNLVPNPSKFPDGMAAVASYVHSLGLKLGIYEDAGTATCQGYPGSYGHEQQDADLFASWGVDYLKYDWCNIPFSSFPGQSHEQVAQTLYTRMSNALKATSRPIVFSMCNGWDSSVQPWTWAGPVANLWRTTNDIQANFSSMLNNFHINVGLAADAGPGAWNDPGMLEIGNGMSAAEDQSEFSLWAEMAAPLIEGSNLTSASSSTGLISGTPTAAGTSTVTVTATDGTGASGSATFTWTVSGSSPPPPGGCQVTYATQSQWVGGFVAQVTIANNGSSAISAWTLGFTFPGDQKITNAWNDGSYTQTGENVTVTNASYNGTIQPGGSTTLGFQGTWNSSDATPTAFTLNGTTCTS